MFKKNIFLLDSGAVISSLPRDWTQDIGVDLAFLPRITFGGFGGKTSLAYQWKMVVLLAGKEIVLPVVFTEAAGTKSLLGRKGFFDNYKKEIGESIRRGANVIELDFQKLSEQFRLVLLFR